MVDTNVIEIELDGPNNECPMLFDRRLRGRFDWTRVKDKDAEGHLRDLVIPGQILGLELETGRAYVREPLREDKYEGVRKQLQKDREYTFPPELDELGEQHVPTALHWIRQAIDLNYATIVKGKFPEKVDGEPRLLKKTREEARLDKLTDAVTAMVNGFENLCKLLAARK